MKSVFSLYKLRRVIWSLAVNDIASKYKGSMVGAAWTLINPLLLLAVYTFVFSVVMKARWPGGGERDSLEFSVIIFSGLLVFWFFSECVQRAPMTLRSNMTYVKKTMFPTEILPMVPVLSALFHFFVNFLVLMTFSMVVMGKFHPAALFAPLIILPFFILCCGLSWILSILGVAARDIEQMVGMITTLFLFLSPIFYPITAVPERLRTVYQLNPLTPVIEQMRGAVIYGHAPDFLGLLIYMAVSVTVAAGGLLFFLRIKKLLAEII
ncbi:MAG: ABC transporter permease [Nitrospinota bacterium]|nr:ABC transporter permease [Nitrospinota bacterium]